MTQTHKFPPQSAGCHAPAGARHRETGPAATGGRQTRRARRQTSTPGTRGPTHAPGRDGKMDIWIFSLNSGLYKIYSFVLCIEKTFK